MGKLYELLPAEAAWAGQWEKIRTEAIGTFSHRDRFDGVVRSLKMTDAARQAEETVETKVITTTVKDKLTYCGKFFSQYVDAFLQKEATNQEAVADIVLEDGTVFANGIPATALLGLESKLAKFREMLDTIPTLAPGIDWEELPDETFKIKNPVVRMKTEKSRQFMSVAKATDKHPEQVQVWDADKVVGKYEDTLTSGCVNPHSKHKLLERCDAILMAVKKARQRANDVTVCDAKLGEKIVAHILAQ